METDRIRRIDFRRVNLDRDIHLLFMLPGDTDVNRWYSEGARTSRVSG